MTRDINSVDEIETGDIISKGMQEYEVVEIRPEPDGFGPPFQATLEAQKDLGDFGSAGDIEELGKGDLLSGYEIIDWSQMIPEGKEIGYECVNGHINEKHGSKRVSADRGSSTNNLMPACIDCGARLRRTLIPLLECEDCGNVWPYSGDADRPTCSSCRGKRVHPVTEQ